MHYNIRTTIRIHSKRQFLSLLILPFIRRTLSLLGKKSLIQIFNSHLYMWILVLNALISYAYPSSHSLIVVSELISEHVKKKTHISMKLWKERGKNRTHSALQTNDRFMYIWTMNELLLHRKKINERSDHIKNSLAKPCCNMKWLTFACVCLSAQVSTMKPIEDLNTLVFNRAIFHKNCSKIIGIFWIQIHKCNREIISILRYHAVEQRENLTLFFVTWMIEMDFNFILLFCIDINQLNRRIERGIDQS